MVQRYEQKRRLQWYKRGAAYQELVIQGEGWVKGGEGSTKPFTRHTLCISITYTQKVKGEG